MVVEAVDTVVANLAMVGFREALDLACWAMPVIIKACLPVYQRQIVRVPVCSFYAFRVGQLTSLSDGILLLRVKREQ